MSDTFPVESRSRTAIDAEAFQRLAQRHRRELQVHCYRMLGSLPDAEDAVQEALLRAWRGLKRFEGRASLRAWLYKIATNECLRALGRSGIRRRLLPDGQAPPVAFAPLAEPDTEVAWLDPYPDAALEGIPAADPGPAARYEAREAVSLAFIAAVQTLPARQRAVLLLRDVLGWSARDTAATLDTSVPSVNSALQRSRAALRRRFPGGRPRAHRPPDNRQRRLLDRYVQAWHDADVDGLVALLRDDVVWTMPPWREWYVGRAAVREFIRWAWRSDRYRLQRLVPTAANAQPAFAYYRSQGDARECRPFAIQVLTLSDDAVAAVTNFVNPALFVPFDLPLVLPFEGPPPEPVADR